jgi:hypothetical protein
MQAFARWKVGQMDRNGLGLLLTGLSLVLYTCVLPVLPGDQRIANGAHFLIGLMLGLGVTLMVAAQLARRRKAQGADTGNC